MSEWLVAPEPALRRGGVSLRNFAESDRDALIDAIRDPLVERYELIQATPTDQDQREWVDALLAPPSGQTARFAIVEDEIPYASGGISIHVVGHHNRAEAGFWVARAAVGGASRRRHWG